MGATKPNKGEIQASIKISQLLIHKLLVMESGWHPATLLEKNQIILRTAARTHMRLRTVERQRI